MTIGDESVSMRPRDDTSRASAVTVRPRAYDAAWMRRGKSETSKRARGRGDGRARRRGRWMDDGRMAWMAWGARARWTVFAGFCAMRTRWPRSRDRRWERVIARAFGAMRAREACGVTTRRGGKGQRGGTDASGRVEPRARTRIWGLVDVGEVCGKGKTIEDYVSRWRAGPFEPYGGRRKDCACAVCAARGRDDEGAAALIRGFLAVRVVWTWKTRTHGGG